MNEEMTTIMQEAHPGIAQALQEKGIAALTEIQVKAIPVLLKHEGDFIGRSATGTGKTFAFGIPLLSRIDTQVGKVQAVILVPTRELCEQIGQELSYLGKHIPDLKIAAIYGGMSVKAQTRELSSGIHLIVATPGRLVDLIERKVVYLSTVRFIVFDEADEMLLKGFRPDIDQILDRTDRTYATWLFSATMSGEVKNLINEYLHQDLTKVLTEEARGVNQAIQHKHIVVAAEEKLNVLLHFLKAYSREKIIIFCRTKSGVQKLYKQLSANKFASGAIHGDLPQGLRNKVMEQFREGHISILIATDVAARGVDVESVSIILQYHLADTKESYIHRSGRTSRKGNIGTSITFVFPDELDLLQDLEQQIRLELTPLPIPTPKDQLIGRAIVWAQKIAKSKPLSDQVAEASKAEFKQQLAHLSKDEILEKMMAVFLREKANQTH